MKHLKCLGEMVAVTPTGPDMLSRACHTAVGGVEIHFIGVFEVPQYAHALEHVNVLAVIDNAGKVVKIASGGVSVFVFGRVGDHDRRSAGRKVYP
jgi:hypothetical protein